MQVTRMRGALAVGLALGVALSPLAALASDNKIALVPGGPHPYFAPWEQAAADAQKDFGIAAVEYKVPAEWKLELQTELFESLAAQGYAGIGYFPGDAVGVNSTIAELKASDIPAVALGGCALDPTDTAFCMATDVYASAYLGTKALIEAMGGKGAVVHLAGLLVDPNTTLRVQAVEKAVAETNGAVTLLQTLGDTDNQEQGDQKINALLAAQKDQIGGMIATGYISSVVAATALKNLGDKKIKLIGIDDDKIVLDGIKDGFVAGTMAQNPYGQGYIGAYAVDLLAEGCTVKADAPFITTPQTARFIDSGTLLINAANLESYKDDLKKLTGELQASFKDKFLSCP
ncbi:MULTISPECIES: sugar ABC transporter substrate-binding protein [unclassified Devosia]|uniref:sugar ABC transporter substrate-binding protein n=1 Tax=unclassified Devosia TaxID=196773 RepID=UPI00086BF2F1|nr:MULTISPECIES: sugar ABC transporter substrate-binding protein [unclassified Devosia]MBN9365139.1 sugar ABC transporter substrate-binding protein [Devosia sp.]ODS81275.1 MAG: sugar ABC transporter substrate-binding protein [Devosia sp. SCN 66-27]OJX21361.1 MAG: sugar ABC transporter substrate-binding protein [Devosia sp. 66-14]